MTHSAIVGGGGRLNAAGMDATGGPLPLDHYLRLIIHRRWVVIGVFLLVSIITFVISYRLADVYTSDTLILVDPQKVPETYVRPTVTGDVRNRLGTLSQQILSATRLQKVIEKFNLYPEERKTLPREDVITRMRRDITVRVVSDFGGSQDLQAFRISYSGPQPPVVAQVTNELASLFIEENLKAREQQATGTTEFLKNQLEETRKTLEMQEKQLRDFKLLHIGELPEQQTAALQILGQLQSQLQIESEALSRAEQQRSYIQSLMVQSAPVVDVDEPDQGEAVGNANPGVSPSLANARARLAALLSRYTDKHPDVQKLEKQIEEEEAKSATTAPAAPQATPVVRRVQKVTLPPKNDVNPVLQAQLTTLDKEIAKRQEEQQRLTKQIAAYRAKVEAIPVREQQMTQLVRDYAISKEHYKQLLEKQLSAETATQLEIRQKGEKFTILDPAQVPERPSSPKRWLINLAGSGAGLMLAVLMAIVTEFFGISITAPQHVTAATGLAVLEVIPFIQTRADRRKQRARIVWATVSGVVTLMVCCVILLYHFRNQLF